MEILIKVIQFFLSLTILVGIHELGHFLMARLFKIRVEKFYIFFDPWFSLFKFKRGETEYGIGWIPMGGYVKIAGMIDESMDTEQMQQPVREDEFRAKPAWKRFLVMIAGVVMNLVLAIAIYIGVCYAWGESYIANEDVRWGCNFNETGHALGFEDGDRIRSIDGEPIENFAHIVGRLIIADGAREVVVERGGEQVTLTIPMEQLIETRRAKGYEGMVTLRVPFLIDRPTAPGVQELRHGDEVVAIDELAGADVAAYTALLKERAGDSVTLQVLRGEERFSLRAPVSGEGMLGVALLPPYTLRTRDYTLLEAVPAGFRKAGETLSSYWQQLKMIVKPETKMYEELGGFLAIGNIFPGEWDWHAFWMMTAFLSIILAVMNILPIPGLDGGHALFTLWEMITGRKVSDRVLEAAQWVGMVALFALLLYVNGNDIYRFFIK